MLLICYNYIKILDDKGKLVIKIDHDLEYDDYDSKYIIYINIRVFSYEN